MTTVKETHGELQAALEEFASSPRFNFLKTIQVGPLLGDDASTLGPLAEITFEQLVASADQQFSALRALDDSQERLLITVLHALAEGEGAESPDGGVESGGEVDAAASEEPSETTFNSVQCELEVRDRVVHLKAHPELARVAHVTLGTFWSAESPRAPFEESLTIRQFLSLDLGVLAKKRSMTSLRMRALARALEGATRHLGGVDESPSIEAVAPVQTRCSDPVREPVARHKWHGYAGASSPIEMALIECVVHASSDAERNAMTVLGALHHFCSVFTPADFLRIMGSAPLTVPAQRKLAAWANSGALREVVPSILLALQGPGTHISRIARLLQGHNSPGAVFAIAGTLIARGLGASQVCVGGAVCPDVWTCNPGLITLIARQMQVERKQSWATTLSTYCPEMDPFLQSWLHGVSSPTKTAKKSHRRR